MHLTQADWTPGSDTRKALFQYVVGVLNREAGAKEFVASDDISGPLIKHIPTNIRLGLRPSMPANPLKPFDIWMRSCHRFPVKADGTFNAKKLVQRVNEVKDLWND